MLNIKQRCFPFAGLLTVHFRAGKIGRWLLSEVGGAGTHRAEQITRLQPDLRNNSDPACRRPNKLGRCAGGASARRLPGLCRWRSSSHGSGGRGGRGGARGGGAHRRGP